jgi:hypothetical protein
MGADFKSVTLNQNTGGSVMTLLSHGQQAAFRFPGQKGNSESEGSSRKTKAHRRTKEKNQPDREGKRRYRRTEPVRSKTVEKTVKQDGKTKVANITFPIRLTAAEHAEWKDFATKNRFSLHQFIKNAMEDLIARIKQGNSISWLKIG